MFNPLDHYWIVGDRPGEIFSSSRGEYVSESDAEYLDRLAQPDVMVTGIRTHSELVEVLRHHGVPPYHRVFTYTVVKRLDDAGLLGAADAAISSNLSARWRFSQATGIDADDIETRALLTAIGANPDEILAPEQ